MKPKQARNSPKKPRKLSEGQKLVIRLVTDMAGCYNPQTWGREMRLAKKMLETHGLEFLTWMPKPEGYQVGSLMWFFTDLGKNYIADQKVEYSKRSIGLNAQENVVVLSDSKIGEDVEITRPKTLKEFLYGEKS